MPEDKFQFLNEINALLICPCCAGQLTIKDDGIYCKNCFQYFPIRDNIPLLFWPNEWHALKEDVTDVIQKFYERTPFPNYNDFDNISSLINKSMEGIFSRLLDEQVPFGTMVLECGCGTGQLSNFLSISNRNVIGTDICLNSLRLAQHFKEKTQLRRVHFIQMNLFRPVFKPNSFDLVICNGVLHHTSDPFGGYKSISSLVKPGGYIIIGLYHKWGRILTDIRRIVFKVTKKRLQLLDSRLRRSDINEVRRNAWFVDQYENPHESKHLIREVQSWFRQSNFYFVKSIPKPRIFSKFAPDEKLFIAEKRVNWLEQYLRELLMMFTASNEGGFFVVIGRKRL